MANYVAKNYRLILKAETRQAEVIAAQVVGIRNISVWEVLIPVLFVFGFIQSRQRRDLCAQNLMFTKQTALRGARDMRLKQTPRDEILAAFDAHGDTLLREDQGGVYSRDIQRSQNAEIALLIDHYLKLLDARGASCDDLIRHAYRTRHEYQQFLEDLIAAENRVLEAATATLGSNTDHKAMQRLQQTSETAYLRHAERLYAQPETVAP